MTYGVSSMTAELKRVAVRSPSASLINADPLTWHYGASFDAAKLMSQHERFVACLRDAGCDVVFMEGDDLGNADAVFTYDASLVTPKGAVLMSPGKSLRRGEQDLHRQFYNQYDIPVLGQISGAATAEAGDTLWLDEGVLAVGRSFRTNQAGIDQLRSCLFEIGIYVRAFDLPFYKGPSACLHLMSLISLVDTRTALVCEDLVPVGLMQLLAELGYRTIATPIEEFEATGTLSTNVLATSPGQCIMLDHIPRTRAVLEAAGVEITVFEGDALCIACEGRPTCLTRPLLRQTRVKQ